MAAAAGFIPRVSDYILDGGNVVDDYQGRIIVTERFLEDNRLSKQEGKAVLKEIYGARNRSLSFPTTTTSWVMPTEW